MDEFDQSITCVGRLLSIPALFTLENSTSAMKHFSLPKSTYELPTTAISSLFQEFWTLPNVPWFREMFSRQETFGQLECDSNKGSRIINCESLNEPFTPLLILLWTCFWSKSWHARFIKFIGLYPPFSNSKNRVNALWWLTDSSTCAYSPFDILFPNQYWILLNYIPSNSYFRETLQLNICNSITL